jgi:hypothetical protein
MSYSYLNIVTTKVRLPHNLWVYYVNILYTYIVAP